MGLWIELQMAVFTTWFSMMLLYQILPSKVSLNKISALTRAPSLLGAVQVCVAERKRGSTAVLFCFVFSRMKKQTCGTSHTQNILRIYKLKHTLMGTTSYLKAKIWVPFLILEGTFTLHFIHRNCMIYGYQELLQNNVSIWCLTWPQESPVVVCIKEIYTVAYLLDLLVKDLCSQIIGLKM